MSVRPDARRVYAPYTQASWLGPLQHLQLMAQGQDLEMERGARSRHAAERENQRDQNGQHRQESLSVTASKFNYLNKYGVFSKDSSRAWR